MSEYFCFIDIESFPVGTFIPKSIQKSEHALTASYSLEFSPSLFAGHIQFAESETDFNPSFRGHQIKFVKASPIEFLLPDLGSIKLVNGECPIDVATP